MQSLRGCAALKKYHPQKTLPSLRTYRTRVNGTINCDTGQKKLSPPQRGVLTSNSRIDIVLENTITKVPLFTEVRLLLNNTELSF